MGRLKVQPKTKRNRAPDLSLLPHNLSTYINHGCRCPICTLANRFACTKRRQIRRARMAYCSHQEWRYSGIDFIKDNGGKYAVREICRHCTKTRYASRANVVKYIRQLKVSMDEVRERRPDQIALAEKRWAMKQARVAERNVSKGARIIAKRVAGEADRRAKRELEWREQKQEQGKRGKVVV